MMAGPRGAPSLPSLLTGGNNGPSEMMNEYNASGTLTRNLKVRFPPVIIQQQEQRNLASLLTPAGAITVSGDQIVSSTSPNSDPNVSRPRPHGMQKVAKIIGKI